MPSPGNLRRTFKAVGFAEFSGDMDDLERRWPGIERETNHRLARQVVSDARSLARRYGGVAPKAAQSLRASRAAHAVGVLYGGPAVPYGMGAEFGSTRYGQFLRFRRSGYFVSPAFTRLRENAAKHYSEAFDRVLEKVFPG